MLCFCFYNILAEKVLWILVSKSDARCSYGLKVIFQANAWSDIFLSESDIETLRFQWYYIRLLTVRRTISRCEEASYHCEAISLAVRRI